VEIVQTYGHQGPQAGDEFVADLLQRSVDGQWSAQTALNETITEFSANAKPLVLTELPLTTVLYAQLLAELRWEMATAYLDGVVVTHRDAPTLPKDVYAFGDALCDKARKITQQAVQAQVNLRDGGKVRLLSADTLEDYLLNERQVDGAWGAYEAIVTRVVSTITSVMAEQRPERFTAFIESDVRPVRAKIEAFRLLQNEWYTTRLSNNKLELARDAAVYVKELYMLLQQLWAPYFHSSDYSALLKQKPTLSELSISDPWVLTDPRQKATKQGSNEALQELTSFWTSLNDPAATLQLAEKVQQLLATRVIRRRTNFGYSSMPWPSQFMVRRAFTLGAMSFSPGDLVAYYTSLDASGRFNVQLRRTGKLTRIADLLGQY
jgi:hypothetical protein